MAVGTPPPPTPPGPPPTAQAPQPLTARQAAVLNVVLDYYRFMRRPCPAAFVVDRLSLRWHEAARGHFAALYRKGWLVNETSPVQPRFPGRRPRQTGSLYRY